MLLVLLSPGTCEHPRSADMLLEQETMQEYASNLLVSAAEVRVPLHCSIEVSANFPYG